MQTQYLHATLCVVMHDVGKFKKRLKITSAHNLILLLYSLYTCTVTHLWQLAMYKKKKTFLNFFKAPGNWFTLSRIIAQFQVCKCNGRVGKRFQVFLVGSDVPA